MGNSCFVGRNNENVTKEEEAKFEEEVMKNDYKSKDRKVKIVLTRDELEKLILFQLNADGGDKGGDTATFASFGDFLRELEAERLAGEAAAAAEEEKSRRRLCRKWKPSLDSVNEEITRSYNRSDVSRFRWTDDLEGHFAYAVQKLGGERSATPKRIWKLMNRPDVTISNVKSHLQIYRTIRKKQRKQEKRQAYLRARLTRYVIRRQTQLHLRLYERFRDAAFSFRNQQRQEKEMYKMTIEIGEPSNLTQEVSCNSLYQSLTSTLGLNVTGENGEDNGIHTKGDGDNDENSCLELKLGLNYQS